MKNASTKKAILNSVTTRIRKNSMIVSQSKSESSPELCLRYNTSVQQQDIFKRVCKALLLKSKTLLDLIEDGEWVHVSIISEGNSAIKVYYNGMFANAVLTKDDFIDNANILYSTMSSLYIKGYVSLDLSIDRTN